jgi:apurinic endonuclease APN1
MTNILRIGSNMYTDKGFVSTAEYSDKIGANFFQIFLSSPQQYNGPRHTVQEFADLKKEIEKYNSMVVVHASYMLNFCNASKTPQHQSAIKLLIKDMNESARLGPNCLGVVIHMGKRLKMDPVVAISNYVRGVQTVLCQTPSNTTIILETGAGVGTEVCSDLIGLGELYRRFTDAEQLRLMFCIDTCHVFSAGYDLNSKQYIEIFDYIVRENLSWSKVACVHLNDSKCTFNSRKDRHADLGKGYIKEEGLKEFVKLCYSNGVPMVLETPCEEITKIEQIQMVKEWIK